MTEIRGSIVNIERFRMDTDGEGIATLVALYGCNLGCRYCANKECRNQKYKKEVSAKEVARILMKDALYYRATNGAVVFGGGEPLLQSDFIRSVCYELDEDINIRIETALNVPWETIERLTGIVDKWIIDIKDTVPQIYKNYTGWDNGRVLYNLNRLVEAVGKDKVHVRIPRIEHYNDDISVGISVDLVKEQWGIEPEVFDYIVGDETLKTVKESSKLVTEEAVNVKKNETFSESALSFFNKILRS